MKAAGFLFGRRLARRREDTPVETYVINLRSSTERWQSMQRVLSIAGVAASSKWDGVDGRSLTERDIEALQNAGRLSHDLSKFDPARRFGEIGCALSHTAVLRDIVSRNLPSALILEDDIELAGDPSTWRKRYRAAFNDLPHDWDIWYLNRCFDLEPRVVRVTRRLIRPWSPLCLCAYAVTARGARLLLEVVEPIHDALDRMYLDRAIRPGLARAYAASPMLFRAGDHSSIINRGNPSHEFVIDGINQPPEYWPEESYEWLGEPLPKRRSPRAWLLLAVIVLALTVWICLR